MLLSKRTSARPPLFCYVSHFCLLAPQLLCLLLVHQVDFLFGKMAARRERSPLDTSKLLDLLLRLARSDQQVRP